jgi:hypothetical protein
VRTWSQVAFFDGDADGFGLGMDKRGRNPVASSIPAAWARTRLAVSML